MTEMSKQFGKDSAGSTTDIGFVHQASAASKDHSRESIELTLEEVLHRDNLIAAYNRVVSNKGAAGIDDMTVDDLGDYLRQAWLNLRAQLLSGTYPPLSS